MDIIMRLDELFEETGLKKKAAAKYVKVDATTLTNWCKGKTYPNLYQSALLADFFSQIKKEIKIEDLFERIE